MSNGRSALVRRNCQGRLQRLQLLQRLNGFCIVVFVFVLVIAIALFYDEMHTTMLTKKSIGILNCLRN